MGHPKQRPPRSVPTPTPTPAKYQYGGLSVPMYRTPPFYGSWPDQTLGMGIKKKKKKKAPKNKAQKKGKGLLLGKNSPFKNVPLLNILL